MQPGQHQPVEPIQNFPDFEIESERKHRSPLQLALRRFFRNKLAIMGLIVLTIIVLAAIFAPFLTSHDPVESNMLLVENPPSSEHILGTDSVGRDNFSRLLYGARISLVVGFSAMLFTLTIGLILGAISGYYGGLIDNIIMRIADLVLALPFLVLALTIMTLVETITIKVFIVVIAITAWPGLARIVRGSFLSLREQEFILGARAIGANDFRIIFKYFIPNAIGPIVVNATLMMATMILVESGLSYIGMGVPQPTPTWGNMITEANNLRILRFHPEAWIPPGLAILVTVLSINFIGDGLRDALNPKSDNR